MLTETILPSVRQIDRQARTGPNSVGRTRSMNGQPLDRSDGSPIPYAVLVKLVQSAQQALDGDDDEAKRFILKAADLLDAEVHRRAATEFPERLSAGNRHLAPWQTRRVIQVVEENVGGKIRLEDLARSIRLSPRQFSRAFSSDFGETPYAYVLRRRIERAQEMMMLLTEEPLASIAVRCGLSDQPHLTRMFHRLVGESPASWRRRHRSAKTARANSANEQPAAMAA
jgi:AraC family transcriptional regulator